MLVNAVAIKGNLLRNGPGRNHHPAHLLKRDVRGVRPYHLFARWVLHVRTMDEIIIRGALQCGWPAVVSRLAWLQVKLTSSRIIIVIDPVHVSDFHATVLKLVGFDHERFPFKNQGLDQRLTGVLPARVVTESISESRSSFQVLLRYGARRPSSQQQRQLNFSSLYASG